MTNALSCDSSKCQVVQDASGGSTTWRSGIRGVSRSASGHLNLAEYSLNALLEAVSTAHPVKVSPPIGDFVTQLHHCQKQSLSFMLEKEHQEVAHSQMTRGGWLADEV